MMAGNERLFVKVKALLCTWSHFMEEDLGDMQEYAYSSDVKVQRFVCTGSIDPVDVIQVFIDGYDGVFVGTCEPETCRFMGDKAYKAGNKQASAKLFSLQDALQVVGIVPDRLMVEWLSPKQSDRFPRFIDEFKARLAQHGPLPRDERSLARFEVMRDLLQNFRVRWLLGKKLELTLDRNSFGEKVDGLKFQSTMADALRKEYLRSWLLRVLNKGPATVQEMATATGFPSDLVLKHLMKLRQRGQVAFCGEKGHVPVYCKEGGQ